MADYKRLYVGAKCAPSFYDDGNGGSEWQQGVQYEPLTVVRYKKRLYISKKWITGDDSQTTPQASSLWTAFAAGDSAGAIPCIARVSESFADACKWYTFKASISADGFLTFNCRGIGVNVPSATTYLSGNFLEVVIYKDDLPDDYSFPDDFGARPETLTLSEWSDIRASLGYDLAYSPGWPVQISQINPLGIRYLVYKNTVDDGREAVIVRFSGGGSIRMFYLNGCFKLFNFNGEV